MRTYHHLSLEEREKLYAWKEKGLSFRKIGKLLKRNVGTLTREWKRHTRYGVPYLPCAAHRKAEIEAFKQRYRAPLKNPLVFLYVREHLRGGWSPETIAGRLPLDHPGNTIDDETIYRYVYQRKNRWMKLWENLVLHRKRRMKTFGRKIWGVRLSNAFPLEVRPKEANSRSQAGHWETDNMEGKRSDHTVVSVTVDRMMRITRVRKLADHTAAEKARALTDQFLQEDEKLKKTFTMDRGVENSDHEEVTAVTGMPAYACTAYHSWEKGTVENTIGRIRRYIPKGKSIDGVSQKTLTLIENVLNNTPRKCLGFLTPNEKLERILVASHTC